MKILTYHISYPSGSPVISNQVSPSGISSTDSASLPGVLDWLIFSHTTAHAFCLQVVWSLADLAKLVIEHLPATSRSQLLHFPHRTRWGNYKLFFIPEKVFSVNKNGSESSFFDLSQYFPEEPEPVSLAELQKKADSLQQVFEGLGVTDIHSLASPTAAFKGHSILQRMKDTIPTIFDAPDSLLEAYELALQCTPREWVSNYQIGHFPELHTADLSSAYAAEASRLLDLRDCDFQRSTEMDESAYYGFLIGDFTVYPDSPLAFCSPFLTDRGDGVLINFTGTRKNYPCLLSEVRTLYRNDLGKFRLKYGWFISPSSGIHPRMPFQEPMSVLYLQRGTDGLRSYVLKRVMTGIIGKLLETQKDEAGGQVVEYGEWYNPIYHALCTTNTRLKVFDFLVRNKVAREELVHVGVDGVKTTRYIDLPAQSAMGSWRYSGSEPTIVLSPGAILTPYRSHKRMDYVDMLSFCLEHPGSSHLWKVKNNIVDLHLLFLNQIRVFSRFPSTAKDLLEAPCVSDPVSP
jgi:hypothetical protein